METNFINKFNYILNRCKYIVNELHAKDYFECNNVRFLGIIKINTEFVEINVLMIYGYPISSNELIMKIPFDALFDENKIEELIESTLKQD